MKKILVLAMFLSSFAHGVDGESKLFVEFYKIRLKRALIEKNIADADKVAAEGHYNRGVRLMNASPSAISMSEFESLESNFLSKKAAAAKAASVYEIQKSLLKMAVSKSDLGIEPPVCFEIR